MALLKVTFNTGTEVELEMSADLADNAVASFCRFVAEGKKLDKRTIVDSTQSFYIDYSKVAIVRREF